MLHLLSARGSTRASCRCSGSTGTRRRKLLEQIIRHEAVHAIDGWDDLRRRLQPDRRCFAFFHPQLPDEPLIFVEVALLPEMPAAIAPLIDKRSTPLPPDRSRSPRSIRSATASPACAASRSATS